MKKETIESILTSFDISSNFNLHENDSVIYFPGYRDIYIKETGIIPIDHITVFNDNICGYNHENLVYFCFIKGIKSLETKEYESDEGTELFIVINRNIKETPKKKTKYDWNIEGIKKY